MLNTIKRIVTETPHASYKKPLVYKDKGNQKIMVVAGSESDAVRYIEAIRGRGYSANLYSMYNGRIVSVEG